MRLKGRTALITGGGTGIGRASALRLAGEGARVFLMGRRAEPLHSTAARIRERGGAVGYRAGDITDEDDVRMAVGTATDRFGSLDVLVNNAGHVPEWSHAHETTDESWQKVLDVNLTGAFRVMRAALPRLMDNGGVIVNIASISALKASNSVASYAAAKAGLMALTRSIAAEYGWCGVRCNCVVPSWVETPMTTAFLDDDGTRRDVAGRHPLGRVASADEIAHAVAYLASDDAAFVTGSAHPVDGGMSAL